MNSAPQKILYLEDDAHIAEIAIMALADIAGFEVQHCARGQDAISTYATFKPDLLLFDVMLPDMDGPTTLQAIRDLDAYDDTPVIFMTAKAQVHEQKRYMDLGALTVVVKPFDAFGLGDLISSIWKSRFLSSAA